MRERAPGSWELIVEAGVDPVSGRRRQTAGSLRQAGLELLPTFRGPHYTLLLPDRDADLRTLLSCENVVRINPHDVRPEVS